MTQYPQLCKQCGKCCHLHPHIPTHEYLKIKEYLGDEKTAAAHPNEVMPGWWIFEDPCPLLTETGCMLPEEDRPTTCQIYPFNAIRSDGGWVILLDVVMCPFWNIFGHHYQDAERAVRSLLGKLKDTEAPGNATG